MQSTMDRQAHQRCRQRALELGRGMDPAALPELAGLLRMPAAEVRRLAASAIGKLADFAAELAALGVEFRYDNRFRIIKGYAIRPDFYLPELDLYIEYWGMEDNLDYRIGMLEKKKLYQQAGKRLLSLYARDKPNLRQLLREGLARQSRPALGNPTRRKEN